MANVTKAKAQAAFKAFCKLHGAPADNPIGEGIRDYQTDDRWPFMIHNWDGYAWVIVWEYADYGTDNNIPTPGVFLERINGAVFGIFKV